MLDFCSLYFLNERRPSSAVGTATEILGRMVFTILTDKGRFFLSYNNSPSMVTPTEYHLYNVFGNFFWLATPTADKSTET